MNKNKEYLKTLLNKNILAQFFHFGGD